MTTRGGLNITAAQVPAPTECRVFIVQWMWGTAPAQNHRARTMQDACQRLADAATNVVQLFYSKDAVESVHVTEEPLTLEQFGETFDPMFNEARIISRKLGTLDCFMQGNADAWDFYTAEAERLARRMLNIVGGHQCWSLCMCGQLGTEHGISGINRVLLGEMPGPLAHLADGPLRPVPPPRR